MLSESRKKKPQQTYAIFNKMTRKKTAYQDWKPLDNNYLIPAKHNGKAVTLPTPAKAEWGPSLPPLSGYNEAPQLFFYLPSGWWSEVVK